MRDGRPDVAGVEPFGVPERIRDGGCNAKQPDPFDFLEPAAAEAGATPVDRSLGPFVDRRIGDQDLRIRHRIDERLAPQGQEERVAAAVRRDPLEDVTIRAQSGAMRRQRH